MRIQRVVQVLAKVSCRTATPVFKDMQISPSLILQDVNRERTMFGTHVVSNDARFLASTAFLLKELVGPHYKTFPLVLSSQALGLCFIYLLKFFKWLHPYSILYVWCLKHSEDNIIVIILCFENHIELGWRQAFKYLTIYTNDETTLLAKLEITRGQVSILH